MPKTRTIFQTASAALITEMPIPEGRIVSIQLSSGDTVQAASMLSVSRSPNILDEALGTLQFTRNGGGPNSLNIQVSVPIGPGQGKLFIHNGDVLDPASAQVVVEV